MSFVAIVFIQTAFFVENNPPFKFTLPVVIVFPKTIALLFYLFYNPITITSITNI